MAPIFSLILPPLLEAAKSAAKSLFPDPADEQKRTDAEHNFTLSVMQQSQAIEQAATDIVKAEAQSGNWLAAAWRPITMLTFVSLIVARWLGFSAPGISEEEVLKLWDIVQLGLGGYVIGRSAEKIVPAIAEALSRR